jgi:hypothetical protein
MSIWSQCEGYKYCRDFDLEPWRIVEAQHVSSSRDLVDSREEHDLLEALLEKAKPAINSKKHYLVFTPFRYPPLKYGSRFGYSYEPSLWYGSINIYTAFAEVAYYRLKFFDDSSADLEYIETPMSAFKAFIKAENGVDLTAFPFAKFQDMISHKTTYEYSQVLGSEMRKVGLEVFLYTSARAKTLGKNVAAFTPEIFQMKNNQYTSPIQNWRCIACKNTIEFTRDGVLNNKFYEFFTDEF